MTPRCLANKQGAVMWTRDETKSYHRPTEFGVPCPWSLLESVNGFAQTTNRMWGMIIAGRGAHINLLYKISIEKNILHVHLKNIPLSTSSNNKNSANRSES